MPVIVSASALTRHCGYARALRRERPPTSSQQEAIDRGVRFHREIEQWLFGGLPPEVDDDLELQGWVDMLIQLAPPGMVGAGTEVEVLWGLGFDGQYVQPVETAPHVYEPAPGQPALLTAGRADIAWERQGCVYVADWKTGKWPAPPAADNLQVNAAGLALIARINAASYIPMIYYARDGYWDVGREVVRGTPEWLAAFGHVKTAALLDETPRPGQWCSGCWERKACEHARG